MKVFVWERIDHCSDDYHKEGGVVVFAGTLERAKELAIKEGCVFGEDEAPDDVREVIGGDEKVFIMKDVGCC